MDAYLNEMELDVCAFYEIMTATNAMVSGSAPLSLYLKEHGRESFEPGDMDIFVGNNLFACMYRGRLSYRFTGTEWTTFLKGQRYHLVDESTNMYDMSLTDIVYVQTWMRRQHKIQVVLLMTENVYEYLLGHIDLSVCLSWWTPEMGLCTYDSYYTLRREFYVVRETKQERMNKYLRRGFKEVENVPYLEVMDEREGKIDGTAMDVIQYEEVKIDDFLKESLFHIVVKVAEQWSAYRRKELLEYMNEHVLGDLYDTPFRQAVTKEGMDRLMYGDYSIYEMVPMGSMVVNGEERTYYEIFAYSTRTWR